MRSMPADTRLRPASLRPVACSFSLWSGYLPYLSPLHLPGNPGRSSLALLLALHRFPFTWRLLPCEVSRPPTLGLGFLLLILVKASIHWAVSLFCVCVWVFTHAPFYMLLNLVDTMRQRQRRCKLCQPSAA